MHTATIARSDYTARDLQTSTRDAGSADGVPRLHTSNAHATVEKSRNSAIILLDTQF